MNKIDYKSAYESVLIANGMLRQENNQLKERIAYLERSCERKEETIRNERDENIELSNKIDKAIEYLINPPKKIWEGHSIDEVVRILKGDVDE